MICKLNLYNIDLIEKNELLVETNWDSISTNICLADIDWWKPVLTIIHHKQAYQNNSKLPNSNFLITKMFPIDCWLPAQSVYQTIGDMHGPSNAKVCWTAHRVDGAISIRLHDCVRWPDDITSLQREYREPAAIPGLIGKYLGTCASTHISSIQKGMSLVKKLCIMRKSAKSVSEGPEYKLCIPIPSWIYCKRLKLDILLSLTVLAQQVSMNAKLKYLTEADALVGLARSNMFSKFIYSRVPSKNVTETCLSSYRKLLTAFRVQQGKNKVMYGVWGYWQGSASFAFLALSDDKPICRICLDRQT